MEDALNKLDKLTHEEARMSVTETLNAMHAVDESEGCRECCARHRQ